MIVILSVVNMMDYISSDTSLLFAKCSRRGCVDIMIIDENVLEDTETLFVSLELNGLDKRISLDPNIGMIEIIDDESPCESS